MRPVHSTIAVGVAALLSGSAARADDAQAEKKQACVAASTEGQSLRDAGKLHQAHEQLVACSRDDCPAIVRKYCAEWLTDLESRIPTVVFRAQWGDGTDVTDARVRIDGAPPQPVDGSSVSVDPGEHTVRFEHADDPPTEVRVVVSDGEKGRVVTGRFVAKPTPRIVEERPAVAPPRAEGSGPSPLAIGLAGVGVLGLGGFAYFGLTAKSDLDGFRQNCAPHCAASDVNLVKQNSLFADVSLGVGVVAFGAAAWAFFAHGSQSSSAPASVDVGPTAGGALARVRGSF